MASDGKGKRGCWEGKTEGVGMDVCQLGVSGASSGGDEAGLPPGKYLMPSANIIERGSLGGREVGDGDAGAKVDGVHTSVTGQENTRDATIFGEMDSHLA